MTVMCQQRSLRKGPRAEVQREGWKRRGWARRLSATFTPVRARRKLAGAQRNRTTATVRHTRAMRLDIRSDMKSGNVPRAFAARRTLLGHTEGRCGLAALPGSQTLPGKVKDRCLLPASPPSLPPPPLPPRPSLPLSERLLSARSASLT